MLRTSSQCPLSMHSWSTLSTMVTVDARDSITTSLSRKSMSSAKASMSLVGSLPGPSRNMRGVTLVLSSWAAAIDTDGIRYASTPYMRSATCRMPSMMWWGWKARMRRSSWKGEREALIPLGSSHSTGSDVLKKGSHFSGLFSMLSHSSSRSACVRDRTGDSRCAAAQCSSDSHSKAGFCRSSPGTPGPFPCLPNPSCAMSDPSMISTF
mmetsp:Transcript_34039/g.87276  ORF Transcript_34039/g.87276 Transcript_34039/m.87276 type:complete len:209 (+) Transcript_34039:937-1563(+)